MQRKFTLSSKYAIAHFARLAVLLIFSAAALAADLFLGLERWNRSEYPLVNAGLLALLTLTGLCLMNYGGFLENKPKATKLTAFGMAAAAAIAIWIGVGVFDKHYGLAVLFFVAATAMTAALCSRFFRTTANFISDLLAESDGDGNELHYPGKFVLHDVHSTDSMSSPFGQVVIDGSTVLFVLTDQAEGYILANPDGTLEARKKKFLKNETKEISVDVNGMIAAGQAGMERMMRIVEEGCARRGVPVPSMRYGYTMLLPNFAVETQLVGMEAFRGLTWSTVERKYNEYAERVRNSDYFEGRACFSTFDLQMKLRQPDGDFLMMEGIPCDDTQRELVAQCIADACRLVEV